MSKVWFAEKQNGEILELTELEALTHFERNNISQRMRLKFIGSSDGSLYEVGRQKVKALLETKRQEDVPEYFKLSPEDKKVTDADLRNKYKSDIKVIMDEAYEAELAKAKENGVTPPDKSLRIITMNDGGQADSGTRNKILNSM